MNVLENSVLVSYSLKLIVCLQGQIFWQQMHPIPCAFSPSGKVSQQLQSII